MKEFLLWMCGNLVLGTLMIAALWMLDSHRYSQVQSNYPTHLNITAASPDYEITCKQKSSDLIVCNETKKVDKVK